MIDDATILALKVEVERLVRPIRATRRRKDRMREELWSHLVDRADLYFDDLADPQWAVRQAVALLGDRRALTAELQSSVPFVESLLWTPLGKPRWLDGVGCRLWGLRDLDSPWQIRSALGWASLAALAICFLLNPLLHWLLQRQPDWERVFMFGGAFCALALMTHGALVPFASAVYRRWLGDANAEPAARLALRGALLAGVLLTAGPVFAWVTRDYYVFDAADGIVWSLFALATPAAWAALMALAANDRRHWREWESLVSED